MTERNGDMAILYYDIFFCISVLLTLCYTFIWHKHFDIHFTLIFFGLAVIFISQIFRIGREMQEEQDLTV